MHETNLSRIDLNLLVVFHQVADCRSVTAAADRLSLSQPAVSHALNRLRHLFGDPLFVREKGGLGLTRRASDLVEPVRQALDAVDVALRPRTFDPGATTRRFRLGVTEYTAITLLPSVAHALHVQAPHAGFSFEAIDASSLEQIAKGEIEALFWGTTRPPKPFVVSELFREKQMGAISARHPLAARARSGSLSLEDYLSYKHWRVNYAASVPNLIDTTLEVMGVARRISVETATFGGNTALLEGAPLILTLPSRVLGGSVGKDVVVFPLPFVVPDFVYYLVWHPRTERDPGSAWLRSQIIRTVQQGTFEADSDA